MSSVDITQIKDVALNTGVAVMADQYDTADLVYPLIAEVIGLDRLTDRPYGHRASTLTGVGEPMEYIEGNTADADTMDQGYTWQIGAKLYARSITLPYSLMETANPLREVEVRTLGFVEGFARRSTVFKDERVAGMFNEGAKTAGSAKFFDARYEGQSDTNLGFIYDGLPLFDTAHPLASKPGTTLSNFAASRTLTRENVQLTRTAMMKTNAVDERGNPIGLTPNAIMVPPELEEDLDGIVRSTLRPDTANHAVNLHQGRYVPIVNRYLTDTDGWFMLQRQRGLVVVDTGLPEVRIIDHPSRNCVEIKCQFRVGAAWKDWRPAFGCNISAS